MAKKIIKFFLSLLKGSKSFQVFIKYAREGLLPEQVDGYFSKYDDPIINELKYEVLKS